ncbi:IS66 family transposase [Bradyrhizobium centrosematis]|uniref:IS66 family transposase n=1 Tax=Bradyrhizobium centrosematis TaxID=1300039 RepID=UPI0035B57926
MLEIAHEHCGAPQRKRPEGALARKQAALSEHQGAFGGSEEARRRLEVILGELRREKFGANSEKLRARSVSLAAGRRGDRARHPGRGSGRAEAVIQGQSRSAPDQGSHRNNGCLPAHLPRVELSSSLRARSVRAVAAP